MVQEIRYLYITVIVILIIIIGTILSKSQSREKQFFKAGVESGKLIKMEEFKTIYFPAQPEEIENPMRE